MNNFLSENQAIKLINKILEVSETKDLEIDTAYKLFIRFKKLEGVRSATLDYYRKQMKINKEYFNVNSINRTSDITKDFIQEYLEYLLDKKLTNCYINKLLGNIKLIFTTLTKNNYLDPMDLGIKKLKEEIKEIEVLTEEQVTKLMDHVSTKDIHHQIMIRLFCETGVRKTELLNILVKNVNLNEKKIYLQHTKNHEPRYIFISEKTIELLELYLNAYKFEYLFSNNGKMYTTTAIDSLFIRIKKTLNFDKLGSHLIRHTYCTALAHVNNVNVKIIQKLMGHKTLNVTMRYIHLVKQEELSETSLAFNPICNM